MNTNGIDVSKTAHIMSAVGRQLDFEWGWTLLNFFFIWIPRQVWPNKPVNIDTMIGMQVFGAETYGAGAVPPGLIAEMYWNFWIPGVIVGCFLLGYFLRVVFTQFSAYSDNRNVVLWYVLAFMPLGAAFMGSGFSSALVSFMMTSIPLVIALYYITTRPTVARTSL
jgi:oligosaccharide repeat unit polymerase